MKNKTAVFGLFLSLASFTAFGVSAQAANLTSIQSTISDDTAALDDLMAKPENSIPRDLVHAAQCIASLHVIKAGFIWGGRGGHGVVSCRNSSNEWSAPVFVDIAAASWGLQIGVEVVDLTLVFTNRDAQRSFDHGNLTLDAAGGLTVGPVGRDLSGGTNFKLVDTIYSYSRARGLYVGADIEGSYLTPDSDYNSLVYGTETPAEIFTGATTNTPTIVQPYVDALNRYSM